MTGAATRGRPQWRPLRIVGGTSLFLLLPVVIVSAQNTPEVHNASGKRALAQHKWQEAAGEYEQSLKLQPKQTDAQISYGIALWGLGNRQGAADAFGKATALDPNSARAHLNVAIAYRDLGQPDRALSEVRTALKLKPGYEEAEIALGILLQQTGQVDKAILQYQETTKRHPQSADVHNWLGVAYLQKSRLPDAEREFRTAIKLNGSLIRAYNNLGSALVQSGDVAGAIEVFRTALKVAPDDPEIRLNSAIALRSGGKAAEALPILQTLVKEHPDDPNLALQLGQTLRQSGDLPGGITSAEKALELNGEFREAYYALGSMLKESAAQQRRKLPRSSHTHTGEVSALLRSAEADLNGGKPAQAIDVLRKAVPLDDGDPDAHNLLGSALARTGDLPSAVVELKRAVEIGPSLASAHYSLGVALWFSNQRRDALNELERSIALDPSQYSACSFLGMVLRQTGDAARARQMLQRAIALNGDAPQPYFDLANLYLTQNNLPAALAQLDSGLNLNPQPGAVSDLDLTITQLRTALAPNASNAEARNTLGRLLGLAGAGEQQIVAEFEEAIRTDPNYAEAYNNLGLVYTQSGTDDKAEKAFRSAINASPEFADAHQNLGALLIISDAPGAIRELEKAVALQPQMLKAHYNLAQAYDASGSDNLEKEIEELQKLVAIAPKYPKAEFALGKALLKKGDLQGAVTHLQAAVGADAKSGEAQYQLGLALSRAGRKVEGTAAMAKSRELNADNQRQQAANLDLREGRTLLEANGKTDEALSRFNRVVADNPDSPEGHYYLGMALLQKAENAQAATEFRRALTLSPTYEEAKAELAKLESPASDQRRPAIEGAIREGKFEDAERSLEQYLGDQPKSAWAWYALGYAYYGEHKIGESIKALAQSLQLDIKNPEAHKVLGRDMMLIGRFDAARIEFQQGIRYDPKSAELHYNLGKLYSIQDNWAQAKTCFERAIALNSSFMEAYDGLGLALESLGDKNEATVKYQKAIDLAEQQHARFSAAHVNMSALYNTSGDPKKALAFAQRALEVNPQSDRALFQMAKAYELDGRTDAVIDSLHRAIAINPNSSSYFYLLSTAYRKAGNAEESRVALESFKKLNNLNRELEQKRLDWVKEEGSRAPTKSPAGAGSF